MGKEGGGAIIFGPKPGYCLTIRIFPDYPIEKSQHPINKKISGYYPIHQNFLSGALVNGFLPYPQKFVIPVLEIFYTQSFPVPDFDLHLLDSPNSASSVDSFVLSAGQTCFANGA